MALKVGVYYSHIKISGGRQCCQWFNTFKNLGSHYLSSLLLVASWILLLLYMRFQGGCHRPRHYAVSKHRWRVHLTGKKMVFQKLPENGIVQNWVQEYEKVIISSFTTVYWEMDKRENWTCLLG